jgi:hypothetical protein
MVPAGVSDDPAAAVFLRQGSDLVISAPQFERSDGLQVFGLEIQLTIVVRVG